MYHPEKYSAHNQALARFCHLFNQTSEASGGALLMQPSRRENFREDGEILFRPAATSVLYDFEKRFSHYPRHGAFRFSTFGQFERKLQKPEISLSIQCSTDESGFIVAWHEDYRAEALVHIASKTATGTEQTGKRFTTRFLELSYHQMGRFYRVLDYAFRYNQFNANSFQP